MEWANPSYGFGLVPASQSPEPLLQAQAVLWRQRQQCLSIRELWNTGTSSTRRIAQRISKTRPLTRPISNSILSKNDQTFWIHFASFWFISVTFDVWECILRLAWRRAWAQASDHDSLILDVLSPDTYDIISTFSIVSELHLTEYHGHEPYRRYGCRDTAQEKIIIF